MGIYDRQYYRDDEAPGFSLGSMTRGRSIVMILIGINLAVFIGDALFPGGAAMPGGPTEPGMLSQFLMLYESDAFKPWNWWRLLTYGFAHAGPGHIFGNMIGLFFFGRTAEAIYGASKFLWMYLTAILSGSVIWLVVTTLMSMGGNQIPGALLGASGGVVAVVILFCLKFPHQKIYLYFVLGIPAWIVGTLYVVANLLGMFGVGPDSNSAFLVHLVGAGYAYVFLRTGWELSQIVPSVSTGSISVPNPFASKPKLKIHNPGGGSNSRYEQLEQKADQVLKKLHQEGEASLTARERKILEDYSRSIKQKNR